LPHHQKEPKHKRRHRSKSIRMNDQGEDYYDGDEVLVFQDASSESGNLSDFFNSNGSFSFGGFSCDGEDFVTEPLTHNPGITFNQQVEMVRGDGTIKMIPLNTGFYPSRQYESDPVDYGEEDQDLSMNLDDAAGNKELLIAEVPPFAAGLLPMAVEGVQALATMGADWAAMAARAFGTTKNEEAREEVLENDNDDDVDAEQEEEEVEEEEEGPNDDDNNNKDQLQQEQPEQETNNLLHQPGAGDGANVAADAARAAQ